MKNYTFYYCLSDNCFGKSPTEMFTVSASTYTIASSRFFSFYSNLGSEKISFFRYYHVESLNGKRSLRSLKNSDIVYLSRITQLHNDEGVKIHV